MRILFLLLISAIPGWSQLIRWTGTSGDVILAAAGYKATIQQPATGAKAVTFETAMVYCSVACNVTQSQNGTAAANTAGILNAVDNTSGSIVTKFFTASDVGPGTAIGGIIHIPAGTTILIDLTKVSFPNTGIGTTNYTIVISSITGTANITFLGSER